LKEPEYRIFSINAVSLLTA